MNLTRTRDYAYEGGPLNGRRFAALRPARYRTGAGNYIKPQRAQVQLDGGARGLYVLDAQRRAYVWIEPTPDAVARRRPTLRVESTWLRGHGLVSEGVAHRADGTPKFETLGYVYRGGAGYAKCACGALSPTSLPSQGARQRWHRNHKQDLILSPDTPHST